MSVQRHRVALHIEFAIIFMRDSETETLVEPPSGIDSDNSQSDRKTVLSGFANQSLHHFCADTPALETQGLSTNICATKISLSSLMVCNQPTSVPSSAITRTCAPVPPAARSWFLERFCLDTQLINDPSHFWRNRDVCSTQSHAQELDAIRSALVYSAARYGNLKRPVLPGANPLLPISGLVGNPKT